jgi:sodium/potassium-transporting ATPase subunit alpha
LSIHVEENSSKADKADAIRQIDVHTIPVDLVYQRFSTSPTQGLETPAVARLTQTFGKNVISPPKTQYWKKVLNYVFGGFNFLMWIAFIVTIVSIFTYFYQNCWSIRKSSFPTSLLGILTRKYLIWA